MKVSKEKAAEHRAAIVEAAARLFRERGFDGVTVAEIMRAAGLTHGGFYGHFASKHALAAEACGEAFAGSGEWLESRGGGARDLRRFLASYLSEQHRDDAGEGCPMAALATEVARQDAGVQQSFAAGTERLARALARLLPLDDEAEARRRALLVAAALVGGVALSRATAQADPALSKELLAAVKRELEGMLG